MQMPRHKQHDYYADNCRNHNRDQLLTDKVKIKHQRDTRRNEEKRHVIRKKLTHGFDGSGTHHSPIEQERQNQHPQILPGIVIPGTRANNSPKTGIRK